VIVLKSEFPSQNCRTSEAPKRRQLFIGLSVVLIFFIFISYYLSVNWDEFYSLWRLSYQDTILAGIFLFVGLLLNCYQINLFLQKFDVRLGLFELIFVTHGMMLGNMVIPMRGGSGGFAVYLKKAHRLNYHKFGVIYGGTAVLVGLVSSVMGLGALGFIAIKFGIFEPSLTAVLTALLLGCVYLTLFTPRFKKNGSGRTLNFLIRMNESWVGLTRDVTLLIKVTCALILITLSQTLSLYFIYLAIGRPLSFSATLITSCLGAIAFLVPITPGSLGVFDAVIIEAPRLLGLDTTAAIMGAVWLRILSFVICLALGLPGLFYFFRAIRSTEPEPGE
jgi:glycosyltransferase AglD